jgi:hypothetical protein
MSASAKSLFAMLLVLAVPFLAGAQLRYTTFNGVATITGYGGPPAVVVIPSVTNGFPVTIIGNSAFGGNQRVRGVIIPDSVTNIGASAFSNCGALTNATLSTNLIFMGSFAFSSCSNLTAILIPSGNLSSFAFFNCSNLFTVTMSASVTSIGANAFEACPNLTSITIPSGVTNIGSLPFEFCYGLTNITVDALNANYASVAGVLFDKYTNTLIGFPFGRSGSYTNPAGVGNIAVDAFYQCAGLTNVTLLYGVTNIGNDAFYGCSNLTTIALPDSVVAMGPSAFEYCGMISSVVIPEGVTNIQSAAFAGCLSLTNATLSTNLLSIGSSAFSDDTSLPGIIFPGTLNDIDDYAFNFCTNLTGIIFPGSLKSIGYQAFVECSIQNVNIPAGVTNIGLAAFEACRRLTNITVDLLNPAFASADGVLFDKSLATLLSYPPGKSGSYVMPASVTSISELSFVYCTATNIILSAGLTNIANNVFGYCSNGLANLSIPASVAFIGDYAFGGSPLNGVFFQGNAPVLGGTNVFIYDTNTIVYYLPGAVGWTNTFDGQPAVLWNPAAQTTAPNFGVRTNRFGFNITGTTNIPIVVEASTNLGGSYVPLQSLSLTNGLYYFTDAQWTNYSSRFYRFRSP